MTDVTVAFEGYSETYQGYGEGGYGAEYDGLPLAFAEGSPGEVSTTGGALFVVTGSTGTSYVGTVVALGGSLAVVSGLEATTSTNSTIVYTFLNDLGNQSYSDLVPNPGGSWSEISPSGGTSWSELNV